MLSLTAWITFFIFVCGKAFNDDSESFFKYPLTSFDEIKRKNMEMEAKTVPIPVILELVQPPIPIGGNRTKGSRNEGIMDAW